MTRKPTHLIYGVDDRPPWPVTLVMAVQHVFLMSSTLVLPIVLVTEIGGGFALVQGVVACTMLAAGLGTILQAIPRGPVGSGYLCPNLCGPNFFTVSVQAAWLDGLPLMHGMMLIAGLFETALARVIHRLKFLFPTEITGLVVFMVGVSLIPLGASKCLGIQYEGDPINGMNLLVAVLTLVIMMAVNVWSRGRLKLYSVLIGLVCGYGLSTVTGLLAWSDLRRVADAAWAAWPGYAGMFDLKFRWDLLPAFLIASLCGTLKTFGNLVMCEQQNDDDWKEPDMRRISRGITADSMSVIASSVLGGLGTDTSASNVGLCNASGATSRRIGFAAGGLFMLLSFSPKLSALLALMPMPVMGAIVIFVTSFMLLGSIQIILTAKMTPRRAFVIGVPLIFGLSLDILPALYAHVGSWLRPFFNSSLTLSTLLAILLNQILREPKPPAAAGSTGH